MKLLHSIHYRALRIIIGDFTNRVPCREVDRLCGRSTPYQWMNYWNAKKWLSHYPTLETMVQGSQTNSVQDAVLMITDQELVLSLTPHAWGLEEIHLWTVWKCWKKWTLVGQIGIRPQDIFPSTYGAFKQIQIAKWLATFWCPFFSELGNLLTRFVCDESGSQSFKPLYLEQVCTYITLKTS